MEALTLLVPFLTVVYMVVRRIYPRDIYYPRRRDARMLGQKEEVDSWCIDADDRRTALSGRAPTQKEQVY